MSVHRRLYGTKWCLMCTWPLDPTILNLTATCSQMYASRSLENPPNKAQREWSTWLWSETKSMSIESPAVFGPIFASQSLIYRMTIFVTYGCIQGLPSFASRIQCGMPTFTMIWDQIWAALAAKWHAAIKNSALHDDFSGYFM